MTTNKRIIKQQGTTMGEVYLTKAFDETLQEERFTVEHDVTLSGIRTKRSVIDTDDFETALESYQAMIDWEGELDQMRLNTTNEL
jgi:hypothetical protein